MGFSKNKGQVHLAFKTNTNSQMNKCFYIQFYILCVIVIVLPAIVIALGVEFQSFKELALKWATPYSSTFNGQNV